MSNSEPSVVGGTRVWGLVVGYLRLTGLEWAEEERVRVDCWEEVWEESEDEEEVEWERSRWLRELWEEG